MGHISDQGKLTILCCYLQVIGARVAQAVTGIPWTRTCAVRDQSSRHSIHWAKTPAETL